MNRLKNLNRFQKGILIFTAVMVLVFSVLYPKTIAKTGFEYQGTFLEVGMENGDTIYSGNLHGMPVKFTVTEEKTVFYQYDDKSFGPYTAVEDPAAIPKGAANAEDMTGIELRMADDIIFRGGVLKLWDTYRLYDEENAAEHTIYQVLNNQGSTQIEPPISTLLTLMDGPQLTHKGQWGAWIAATLLCILNVITLIFADELFRFSMSFHISNSKTVTPSDWEIARRYFGWTVLVVAALVIYVKGLM
ncbi:MAG: hypothetical protein KBT01_08020 [Clostridiales bacterium]|nr:hypothetical protein [Candidatus Blautia equi]